MDGEGSALWRAGGTASERSVGVVPAWAGASARPDRRAGDVTAGGACSDLLARRGRSAAAALAAAADVGGLSRRQPRSLRSACASRCGGGATATRAATGGAADRNR